MSWTEDRIKLLTDMWAAGHTVGEIVNAMKGAMTRNAIIGKAHRLGLEKRASPILDAMAGVKPTKSEARDEMMRKRSALVRETWAKKREDRAADFKKAHAENTKRRRQERMAQRPVMKTTQQEQPAVAAPVFVARPKPVLVAVPDPENVGTMTFMQAVDAKGCLYPHGEKPNMTWCGGHRLGTSSYCQKHYRVVWTETPKPTAGYKPTSFR